MIRIALVCNLFRKKINLFFTIQYVSQVHVYLFEKVIPLWDRDLQRGLESINWVIEDIQMFFSQTFSYSETDFTCI